MRCRKIRSQGLLGMIMVLILGVAASGAQAQEQFDVQGFHPVPSQQMNYFGVASARVMSHLDWELGLLLNYADDPLVLVFGDDDERMSSVVASQLTLSFLAAFGLFDWFELGVGVPLILMQDGDSNTIVPDAVDAGFGLGDIRVVPRFQLFTTESIQDPGGFTLGLMANVWIPVGDIERFQGEAFRFEPRLVLDLAFGRAVRLSADVGYYYRDDTQFLNLEVDDALTAGLAASFAFSKAIALVPEITASIPILADSMDLEETPVEALLGLKIFPVQGLLIELGGGTGIIEGFSSPDWRAFLGLSYSPSESNDRDGDGYPNDEDGCPDDPEDFDGFEDADGCPDPDNDGDGILDVNDSCPNDPEDFDGFQDEDGCPDPDNDGDGILDVNDSCPLEPETVNGYQDEDGCPDMVTHECQRIELEETVYFEYDSDVIQQRSFDLLNQVADQLTRRPDIRRVRVEGHTDSRGSNQYNEDLSQRRAQSVLRYVLDRGVDAGRLIARGFGEEHPIATNSTEQGMAQNRRVEFIILEQDGCEDIQTPY